MFRFLTVGLVTLMSLSLVPALHAGGKKTDEKEFKVEGKLTKDDPTDKVLKERPFKSYDYKMKSGTIYVIEMKDPNFDPNKGPNFDPVLRLENPQGKQVAINDDGDPGKNLDSRITYKAPADGTYKIIATCLTNVMGNFVLTVRQGTEADLPKPTKPMPDPFAKLIGKPAPEIEGAFTLNGKTKKLSDLKGKVVLVDFWAVWCGPCIATFPHLREWSKDYQKDGLEILGVTTYFQQFGFDKDKGQLSRPGKDLTAAEEHDMLKDFGAHHKLTHQLMAITRDNWGKAAKDYGFQGIPTVAVVDRQGIIRMVRVGATPENTEAIQEEIRKLLKEK